MVLFVTIVILTGCAGVDGPDIANRPADLPDGAQVKVFHYTDNGAIIGIKGVDVLFVEAYGRGIRKPDLEIGEDGWIKFLLPVGRWFNFVFKADDGQYHFVYVTAEDNNMPPKWKDKSIYIYNPPGWGSAMTAKEFFQE